MIEQQIQEALRNIYFLIDIRAEEYKNGVTRANAPVLTKEAFEAYMKKRGYTNTGMNDRSGKVIWCKGFVCTSYHDETVAVWHDIPNAKVLFITESIISGLPGWLTYMERI